jgi:hypothetical protein
VRIGIARVVVSASHRSDDELRDGLAGLAEMGYELLPPSPTPSGADHEVAFVLAGDDRGALSEVALTAARQAFGDVVQPGIVTFMSRGTDDDARGVAAALGLEIEVSRRMEPGGEVVLIHVSHADLARVPEGRLHTALEAALNAEVRITTAPPPP